MPYLCRLIIATMKNNKIKLSIGEFSKLCCVTVKTLRHYEKIGLLLPSEVDAWTGYRYYTLDQMQKMLKIMTLKNLGFSLEEIKEFFDRDFHEPNQEELQEKIEQCEQELAQVKKRLKQLKALANFQKKKEKMKEEIYFEKLPAIIVASHREVIPNWEALGKLCYMVIGPEMQRLGCVCPEPGYCYTIDHFDEYSAENIDVEFCEQVMEMGEDSDIIQFKQIPEVPMAVCKKCFGPYDRLPQHYMEIFAYLDKEGYKITGKPRASYVDGIWNQEDPEKWMTIVQIPAEKVEK